MDFNKYCTQSLRNRNSAAWISSHEQTEDNPHIERIDATHLVLMFDSDNYTGGLGSHDIWYSVSTDNAASWSATAKHLIC